MESLQSTLSQGVGKTINIHLLISQSAVRGPITEVGVDHLVVQDLDLVTRKVRRTVYIPFSAILHFEFLD
jgi:hypothetical protein